MKKLLARLLTFILFVYLPLNSAFAENLRIYQAFQNWGIHLFYDLIQIPGFTVDFEIKEPSHVTIFGHINLEHRGLVKGPVGWALRVGYRYAANDEEFENMSKPTWIKGAKTGGNITSIEHHYAEGNFNGYIKFDKPGKYRIEVWGTSHSSLCPRCDGLIQVLGNGGAEDPYNNMIVRVEKA